MKNQIKNFINNNKKSALDSLTYLSFAVVVVIFVSIVADLLYQPKIIIKRGYEIELSADGKPVTKIEEKPIDLADLMNLADANRGQKIFKKCASCHNVGKNEGSKVGPALYGVIGRAKGIYQGFNYSVALKEKGGIWDRDSINQFITKPKNYITGTKMAFGGLKKPQDRADVILYLEQQAK